MEFHNKSIPVHAHAHGCPFASSASASSSSSSLPNPHGYCPPQPGDSRSPCPALNTLANHGYLPRDGKCITPKVIMDALRDGYRLSLPLAWFLTYGGFYLLGQRSKRITLADLARHNAIEHNASLAHPDVHHRDEYAPTHVDHDLLDQFLAHSKDGSLITPHDVARARIAREASYDKPIDPLHAEIARGEMAIALHLFNNPPPDAPPLLPRSFFARLKHAFTPHKRRRAVHADGSLPGIPVDVLREWFHHERLPDGWQPYHTLSLTNVMEMATVLRQAMRRLAKDRPVTPQTTLAPIDAIKDVMGDLVATIQEQVNAAKADVPLPSPIAAGAHASPPPIAVDIAILEEGAPEVASPTFIDFPDTQAIVPPSSLPDAPATVPASPQSSTFPDSPESSTFPDSPESSTFPDTPPDSPLAQPKRKSFVLQQDRKISFGENVHEVPRVTVITA